MGTEGTSCLEAVTINVVGWWVRQKQELSLCPLLMGAEQSSG